MNLAGLVPIIYVMRAMNIYIKRIIQLELLESIEIPSTMQLQ